MSKDELAREDASRRTEAQRSAGEEVPPRFWIAERVRTFSGIYAWVVRGIKNRNGYISETDARLIAAAPDLLEALKSFVSVFGEGDGGLDAAMRVGLDAELIEARAAIKRATEG